MTRQLGLLAGICAWSCVDVVQAQPAAALVVTARAVQREVTAGQMFVGTIMPTQRAVVGSAVDGRVIDRPFEEGQRIAEGEPLARLLTETISLQLEAEKAELDSRRAMLEELETGARPQELAEARAKVAAADARRKYLASKRERTEMAFRQGRALSEDEVEEATAAAEEAQQAYLQAEAQLELTVEGARQERLAQARAAVAFQQAIVEQLQDQIAKHTVRARFTGYVVAEFTERGAWLKRGDPVAEMAALDVVEAVVYVVEQQVPFVPLGSEVLVEVPALTRTHWPGVVAAVVPQADVRARTFPVKVRLQNEITEDGPILKAGMTARLVLPTGERQDAVLVPKDALVLGGKSPMLYVIAEGKPGEPTTAMPVPVSVGVADGDWIQVIGEVTPGQQVAVQGNERLRPGQPVQVVNAPGAAATGN